MDKMYTEVYADGASGRSVTFRSYGEEVIITIKDESATEVALCELTLEEWRLLLKQMSLMTFPPRSSMHNYNFDD